MAAMITAHAQYPERAIIAVVPFAAGSSNDTIARRVSPRLAKALGQQVIIENRPGADGRIGIEVVAKAQPDAYTILFSGGAVALIPAEGVAASKPYSTVRMRPA